MATPGAFQTSAPEPGAFEATPAADSSDYLRRRREYYIRRQRARQAGRRELWAGQSRIRRQW